jgi:inner membrane protein
MTYKTHSTMAIAATLGLGLLPEPINPFYTLQNPIYIPIVFFVVFVSSLAPDFDEPGSYLSSKFPWILISALISTVASHRGITHRFLAIPVFAGIITCILIGVGLLKELWVLVPISALSYGMHMIGDGMTKGGLRRFWYPFSKKTVWFIPKSLTFYTGSFVEGVILFLVSMIICVEVYFLITLNSSLIQNVQNLNLL